MVQKESGKKREQVNHIRSLCILNYDFLNEMRTIIPLWYHKFPMFINLLFWFVYLFLT